MVFELDFTMIKRLNDIGLTGSIYNAKDGSEVETLAFSIYNKIGVFVDSRCYTQEVAYLIFSNASDYRYYGELHRWLVIGSDLEDVINSLNDDAFNLSTDFVIAVPSNDSSVEIKKLDLYETYNLWKKRGTNLTINYLGSWSEDHELNIVMNKSKLMRGADMNGLPFKAYCYLSVARPINMDLEDYLQLSTSVPVDGMEKFSYNVIRSFAEMHNFKLLMSMAPFWMPGDNVGPIQRAIYNDSIDIGGGASIVHSRFKYIRYAHMSWPERSCFMFRTSKKSDIRMTEIFGPFDVEVWNLLIVLTILGTVLMSILFWYESQDARITRYSTSFLLLVGSMCQQGTDIEMARISTRSAFLWIMIFSLLIYNYYGAAVVSVRLSEPIMKINDSLISLSKTDLKFASQWLAYLELIIKSADYEVQTFYNKIWKNIPDSEKFLKPEEGIRLVKKGGFAYHTLPEVSYPLISRTFNDREICELTEVHLWGPTWSGFTINRNSTIIELIRVGLTRIADSGIQNCQVIRWSASKPECVANTMDSSGLTIYEFAPHLIVLAIGMGISIIIWMTELWIFVKQGSKEVGQDDATIRRAWT